MKKNLSVLALLAQNTIYKILAILAAMTAAEFFLFYCKFTDLADTFRVEDILSQSYFSTVFLLALISLIAVIWSFYTGKNSRITRHTVYRLSVSTGTVFTITAVYAMCCILLLTAVQLLTAWVCCQIYTGHAAGADVSHITFLAFYRTGLLHGLLPLANTSGYLRNFAVILLLGILTSTPVLRKGGAFDNEEEKSDEIEAKQPSV